MGRLAEAAPVAALGVAVLVGTAQAPHDNGWPTWAIIAMVVGVAIIALAIVNLVFGVLHRPLRWAWRHLRRLRVRIELRPRGAASVKRTEESEAENAKLRSEIGNLAEERQQLRSRVQQQETQIATAQAATKEQIKRVADLRPKVDWADKLIEGERDHQPIVIDRRYVWIHEPESLRANEPKFQLRIGFEYVGVHRLIVGERFKGALARYQGEEYNHEVRVTFDHQKEHEPFVRVGYARGTLCLTQKLTRESADALLELMSRNKEGNLTIGTKYVDVSVRVQVQFSNEELFVGSFPMGEDIQAQYTLEPLTPMTALPASKEPTLRPPPQLHTR